MAVVLRAFDPAEYLEDPVSLAAYLEDAIAGGDAAEFLDALGVVARAKGMTQLARDAGVARPALYRSLSAAGSPEFATVLRVLQAIGVGLHMRPDAGGDESAVADDIDAEMHDLTAPEHRAGATLPSVSSPPGDVAA